MFKPARFFGALAVAALVTSGSAFTASNTFISESQVAGYSEQSSTGALIVQVNYTPWEDDRSRISSVSFVTTTDLTGKTASLTLKDGSTSVATYACETPTPVRVGSRRSFVKSRDTTWSNPMTGLVSPSCSSASGDFLHDQTTAEQAARCRDSRARRAACCVLVARWAFAAWWARQLCHHPRGQHGAGVQRGDLAIVHSADSYDVGDVAAYRSDLFNTVVLHRIVAWHGGHYTFKGDHNSWVDPERPAPGQLIGKHVVRIPQGGAWMQHLASRRHWASMPSSWSEGAEPPSKDDVDDADEGERRCH